MLTQHFKPSVWSRQTSRRIKANGCGTTAQVVPQLREWILRHGGYIHAHLELYEHAPCGCRGVVILEDISPQVLESAPLISVPRHMQLDDVRAAVLLEAALARLSRSGDKPPVPAHCNPLSKGQSGGHEAVALAFEVTQGEQSAWAPYLASLPSQPPCPWLLPVVERTSAVAAVLAAAPPAVFHALAAEGGQHTGAAEEPCTSAARARTQAAWEREVAGMAAEQDASAAHAMSVCGAALGLSHQQILWGLGQVVSRGLTSSSSCALLPFIDLLNHSPAARPPMMQLDDNDQLVTTVTSLKDGELHPMKAGDELYINYSGGGAISPLEAFIKFGFVPEEAWLHQGPLS